MNKAKFFVLVFFICNGILAQKDSLQGKNDLMVWGNCGSGLAVAGKYHSDFAFNYGLNIGFHKKYFILLRYKSLEFAGLNGSFWSNNFDNELLDLKSYSVLFGIGNQQTKYFHPIFSVGPSFGNGIFRGDIIDVIHYSGWWGSNDVPVFAMDTFQYVGVKLDLTLLWAWRYVGMSLEFYANFHKHSDYGITLNYNMGFFGDEKRKGNSLRQ